MWGERGLDILYPPTCPICCGILRTDHKMICPECRKKIKYIKEPLCKKCGKSVLLEEQEYCYDCSKRPHIFIQGRALLTYEDHVKKSIYRFKYKNKREYAKVYANEIILQLGTSIANWKVDGIIPIPLHKSKQRSRGFNQAEILALELSKQLDIPCYSNLIERTRKTLPQKSLNDKQRINNLKNAFKMTGNVVKLRKVILIDDIYTTGITMDSVAEVLLQSGVEEVYFITISIGEGI
jgi:ComF family protein